METEQSRRLERAQKVSGMIGSSDGTQRVLEMIVQVAPIDISILIVGESGSGKEMVARAIHKLSRRAHKRLVAVNCGAIPSGIIESELFGNKKGAYTGATEDRKGYFEEADGGTIFLDEIGETPLPTQVKLLRVIETGEFMKVGAAQSQRVDVRVIAATNRRLEELVNQDAFRKDLFYRLRTVTIEVPPLRKRIEDLEELVERFALQFTRSNDIPYRGFTADAIKTMKSYDWPGNIRELKNFTESILLLERGERITSEMAMRHLPVSPTGLSTQLPVVVNRSPEQAERELILQQLFFLRQDLRDVKAALFGEELDRTGEVRFIPPKTALPARVEIGPESQHHINSDSIGEATMEQVEKELITRTLKKFGNSRRRAAEALKMSERTLYRKIEEYGLEKKRKPRQRIGGDGQAEERGEA